SSVYSRGNLSTSLCSCCYSTLQFVPQTQRFFVHSANAQRARCRKQSYLNSIPLRDSVASLPCPRDSWHSLLRLFASLPVYRDDRYRQSADTPVRFRK